MKNLEGHKAFPYIAWSIVLLFCLLTYYLVQELRVSVRALEQATNATQQELHSPRSNAPRS